MNEEKWERIKGGFMYEISNCGRVRRMIGVVRNNVNGGVRKIGGTFLSAKTKSNGYKEVNLRGGGKQHMFYVHRLVAAAFIGEIPQGGEVNHKDGNKANNNLYNLEIVTSSENRLHAYHELGSTGMKTYYGAKHGMAKLDEKTVLEIREKYSQGVMPTELSKIFRKPLGTITKICYRQTWKHI